MLRLLWIFLSITTLVACKKNTPATVIKVDGSSTVFPLSEAIAEDFQKQNKARVTIGVSGTGGGFKKFCQGEVAVTGASRPITQKEIDLCKTHNIQYIELPVAYDGIVVVVSPNNTWVDALSVEELKTLWRPEAQANVMKWNQVRPSFPDKEIHLFGAGVDSGTYDYFTKAIVGTEHASRGDYTSSEDDNVLVQGVSNDALSLGFFGFAYYKENSSKLKAIPIGTTQPIMPSAQTIKDGTYQPLSRPIFIYVSASAIKDKDTHDFVAYYLQHAARLATEVGYVGLSEQAYTLMNERFTQQKIGSVFNGGSKVGVTVEQLLASEAK